MALHAIDDIGDAFSAMTEMLFPVDLTTWVKLAVITFFIGAGFNLPSTQTGGSSTPGEIDQIPFEITGDVFVILAVVAVIVVFIALIFAIVGAIMEFVFIESLRNERVSIRSYWQSRWKQGLRLFVFRLLIGLPVLLLFAGWIFLLIAPLIFDTQALGISLGVFILTIPLLFVVGLLYGIIMNFTTVFVVPLMIQEDSGVLTGWRRLLPSIKRSWKQYVAYAVIAFVLTLVIGFIAAIILALAAFLLLIPLGMIGVIVLVAGSTPSTINLIVLGILITLFVVGLGVTWALVQVPVVTYLRYYALLVLGDIEPDFDIIPERRAAIRVTNPA